MERTSRKEPVIRELFVPAVADMREPVTLWCRYDLAGARLYSVKWYKDDQEFYRYMPDEQPPAQTFPVPYVSLDRKKRFVVSLGWSPHADAVVNT
ncbi:Uncharacterized protein GBIM_06013 [Gryllus bimaculatus]|nr:Uncharacterized protein GBIM_06013 [Gryllus bimaculatus]